MSDNTEPVQPHHPGAALPPEPAWSAAPATAPQAYPPQQYMPQPMMGQQMMVAPKNPALALIASFFITGLGQLLNGQVGKGIAFFVAAFVAWLSIFVLIGILLVPVIWIWSMVDAYQGAKKWNLAHGIVS